MTDNFKESMHPASVLEKKARDAGLDVADEEFADLMDDQDDLRHLRKEFHYPKMKEMIHVNLSLVNGEEDCIYLCGNSLGLCPKRTSQLMDVQLDKWAKWGVHGHTNGELPWAWCDEDLEEDMLHLIGCKRDEISIMNGLTVNLHLLMISFYQPTKERYKILFEGKAFPSDHYTFESHAKLHGFKAEDVLICLEPREGEDNLRLQDILDVIEKEGDQIAVICFSGVQYYTGQYFDIPSITQAGQKKGCYVGWDLAHAAGNVPLYLHDWGVDFSCWCSYKYMNSGAGSLSGLFLHERHHGKDLMQLQGWWGHKLSTRFKMDNRMDPYPGARSFRISNTPIFTCVPLKASLEIFKQTSMEKLRAKSLLLTGYLEYLIHRYYKRPEGSCMEKDQDNIYIEIFTPSDPAQRGAQLSLAFNVCIEKIYKELEKRGICCDKRLPRVIRIAPAPLYCSFKDVYRFIGYLKESLMAVKNQSI